MPTAVPDRYEECCIAAAERRGVAEVLPWIPSIAEVTTPLAIVSYTSCVVDLMLNKLSAKIEIACARTVSTARRHRGKSTRAGQQHLTEVQVDIAFATD
eukprot:COSAG02_NODE_2940_length_7697_cov_4.700316_7_plen_99_part_00